MLEITIDTLAIDAGVPDVDAINAGEAKPEVHVQVVGGQVLPFADPNQGDRPLRIPSAAINFGLTKEAAYKLSDLLREQADQLPEEKKSGLVTASSLAGIEREAKLQQELRRA